MQFMNGKNHKQGVTKSNWVRLIAYQRDGLGIHATVAWIWLASRSVIFQVFHKFNIRFIALSLFSYMACRRFMFRSNVAYCHFCKKPFHGAWAGHSDARMRGVGKERVNQQVFLPIALILLVFLHFNTFENSAIEKCSVSGFKNVMKFGATLNVFFIEHFCTGNHWYLLCHILYLHSY